MNHLRKPVHNSQDDGVTFQGWHTQDEVNSDVGPGPSGNRERLEETSRRSMGRFPTATHSASNDKLPDIPPHSRAPEVLLEESKSSVDSRMAGEF